MVIHPECFLITFNNYTPFKLHAPTESVLKKIGRHIKRSSIAIILFTVEFPSRFYHLAAMYISNGTWIAINPHLHDLKDDTEKNLSIFLQEKLWPIQEAMDIQLDKVDIFIFKTPPP